MSGRGKTYEGKDAEVETNNTQGKGVVIITQSESRGNQTRISHYLEMVAVVVDSLDDDRQAMFCKTCRQHLR